MTVDWITPSTELDAAKAHIAELETLLARSLVFDRNAAEDGLDALGGWDRMVAMVEAHRVANPVMHKHAKALITGYQPPAQTVQPWWFGDAAFKATGLYLRGLPPLVATNRLTPPAPGTDDHKRWSAIHRASPGPNRARDRSRTFPGIAAAMAAQWGGFAMQVAA